MAQPTAPTPSRTRALEPGPARSRSLPGAPILQAALATLLARTLQAAGTAPARATEAGFPLEGEAAEHFLLTAEVVDMQQLNLGVSHPYQVRLSDGTRTHRAVWKTIIELDMLRRLDRGRPQRDFRDSYKHEIAAYELDKLLGLGLVPPTVERTIEGTHGSLQLWVEGCISERERLDQGLTPPNLTRWNLQMFTVRLLHRLINDIDHNNVNNLLIDPSFRIYVIDSSRGFGLQPTIRRPAALRLFRRPVLERLEALDRDLLTAHLGSWLTGVQIDALLARRDLILQQARAMIQERGEAAVLLP